VISVIAPAPSGIGDMFLMVKGAKCGLIKGEAQDDVHKGEIEVLRWSWGMQAKSSLGGGKDRLDVQVLVGGDDRRGDFRPFQQFPEIRGRVVRLRLLLDELEPLLLEVADPDEVDHRVARGDFAAEQAYAARADDCEADPLRGFSQGMSTAALRSADRSAAI